MKSSALVTTLWNLISITVDQTYAFKNLNEDERRLKSCDGYIIEYPVTAESTIFWTNGGDDSEWINKDNWQFDYLPGVHRSNRVIMASFDVATVNCAATYMVADVEVEMRSRATLGIHSDLNISVLLMTTSAILDIQGNLNIDSELKLQTDSVVTQSNQSQLSIGARLYLASSFFMSGDSSLTIGSYLYMATNGLLEITGDTSTISVAGYCRITGQLVYALGSTGVGTFIVYGRLIIAYATARLTIDASSYTSGEGTIPLIQNAVLVTGSFNPAKISIVGLSGGLTPQVKVENDGLYLELTASTPTVVTPSPTPSPTPAPSPSPSKSPTPAPTVAPIAPNPTPSPTTTPTFSPLPPSPTSPPTPTPTAAPTTANPTTAPNTVDDSVTQIILTSSGFDPITSSGTCPAPDTTLIEIDGTSYIGSPGTITLYDCSFINSNFDIIDYQLLNFQDGLWFEISYSGNRIELNIKSLIDYSEYWNRVRTTFEGEYDENSSTAHFPDFSWDTIPTWVRYRKNLNINEFTDEELEVIAKNHYISWYGLGTPEHVLEIAASIKGYDASHKMLLYWNAESYWGMEIDTFNEDWLVDDATGTGERGLYDHSNPEMRDWWVDHARYMVDEEGIDGEFTDNTLSPECDNAGCDLELTTKSIMIKRLAEELPDNALKLGNFLRQYYDTGNRFRMAYTDGTYFENQHKTTGNQPDHEGIVVSMQMAREASWKKKVVLWTGSRRNCGCGYNNVPIGQVPSECIGFNQVNEEPTPLLQQDLYKSLGEFLMIVEEFSYINFNVSPDANCERWRWDSSGMEEFNRALGEPKGPPLKIGDSFSRHFEHLSVKVNIATEETSIIWH